MGAPSQRTWAGTDGLDQPVAPRLYTMRGSWGGPLAHEVAGRSSEATVIFMIMADPLFELARDVELVLEPLGSPRKDAGRSLSWAAFNLRAARMGQRIVEELASGPGGYARIRVVFPEEWDVLEVAAMSLGFEDVTTAVDLCANAVYLASGGIPSADGSFKDLGYWSAARAASLPDATKKWVLDLITDLDTQLLLQCCEALKADF